MQKNDAYGMRRTDIRSSELSPDLVRVMEIELLGEMSVLGNDSLGITEPTQLPYTGQPVYELPAPIILRLLDIPEDEKVQDNKPTCDSELYVGRIESGGHSIPFFLPNSAIARHIAVLGKTGVGKSYAVGVLMEERYENISRCARLIAWEMPNRQRGNSKENILLPGPTIATFPTLS
ncbi:helicase HerA domain-containing protein [Roseiflexus castenholzii]|jgi:DNA helicase HerA-like ATPase|uniref:helicase HerA domain-containing protein n=1 Tax=Roseiflexus castenholzii TaxID=120962 RepID=UPI000A077A59|nr:DUF87 domain-containing protein [Roseiflexus castenholzii]